MKVNFGFLKIFRKINKRILNSLEIEIFENQFFLTLHRLTLRRVRLRAVLAQNHLKFEYLRENEFLRETILTCVSGAQMGWAGWMDGLMK